MLEPESFVVLSQTFKSDVSPLSSANPSVHTDYPVFASQSCKLLHSAGAVYHLKEIIKAFFLLLKI